MTPAQFKIVRHLLGYNLRELSEVLGVQVRSVQRWEAGERPLSEGICVELENLLKQHKSDAEKVHKRAESGELVRLEHTSWNIAVAARVLSGNPSARFEWTSYRKAGM